MMCRRQSNSKVGVLSRWMKTVVSSSALICVAILLNSSTQVSSLPSPSEFSGGRPDLTPPSSTSSLPVDDYGTLPSTNYDGPNESVEERLEAWRQYQQQKFESQTSLEEANPREENGRMKLIASVSRGSISFFFFILMWRTVHHFEMADLAFKGTLRLTLVVPTIMLFLGNMLGCVFSVTSAGNHSSKKRMKAILNLNKLVEVSLLIYNVIRLTVFPNKFVMREIYVGRTLSNFLFMVQCQLFTKVAWGFAQMKKEVVTSDFDSGSRYYDTTNSGEQQHHDQSQQY